MKKLMEWITSKVLHIVLLTFLGVAFIAESYTPRGTSSSGRSGPSSWGPSFEPIPLAIGVAALVGAWLIYRKWKSTL